MLRARCSSPIYVFVSSCYYMVVSLERLCGARVELRGSCRVSLHLLCMRKTRDDKLSRRHDRHDILIRREVSLSDFPSACLTGSTVAAKALKLTIVAFVPLQPR